MNLLRAIVFLTLLSGVLAIVSLINLNPTGYYPKISTKGGLYVSIVILIYMIFGELGYLPWLRFVGKKKRSVNGSLLNPAIFGDRNTILTLVRKLDPQDCLLRYLCELEALRNESKQGGVPLDPGLEENLILLKVAKRKMHPALLMREDPGSPALPFEVAVFTGTEGIYACEATFSSCPYNITTMQNFLGEDFSNELF